METGTPPSNPWPEPPVRTFPEWASLEIQRLLEARAAAADDQERAQFDLQLAILCDTAQRYGRSLTEIAEF